MRGEIVEVVPRIIERRRGEIVEVAVPRVIEKRLKVMSK